VSGVATVDVGEARRGRHRRPARAGLWIALGWIAVAVTLQLLRQEGAPAIDTLWGEDGKVFLANALREGPLAPVLDPYAGYIHVLPRLVGALVSFLPLRAAAVAFSVIPALIVALLSIYVFVVSKEILRTTIARGALALLVVVPPPGAYETTATLTAIQWNLLLPCFLALALRPKSTAHAVTSTVIGGLTALSAPISLVLVPLSMWRLVRGAPGGERAVQATFLAGAAVQLVLSLLAEEGPRYPTDPAHLPGLFALRVAAGTVVGKGLLGELWPVLHWGLAVAGGGVLLGVVVVCFRHRARGGSLLLLALAASAAMHAVPVFLRGTWPLMPIGDELTRNGARWEVAPVLLFALVLVALADRAWVARTTASMGIAVVLALALGTATVTSFRDDNWRSAGPRWSRSLDVVAERCVGRTEIWVRVTPPSWRARLPCDRLAPTEATARGASTDPRSAG
jgi:hypothetical protein